MACFIGAAVSFRRYDSKNFDLLDELKSVNHRLLDIQSAIEKLQRR